MFLARSKPKVRGAGEHSSDSLCVCYCAIVAVCCGVVYWWWWWWWGCVMVSDRREKVLCLEWVLLGRSVCVCACVRAIYLPLLVCVTGKWCVLARPPLIQTSDLCPPRYTNPRFALTLRHLNPGTATSTKTLPLHMSRCSCGVVVLWGCGAASRSAPTLLTPSRLTSPR